MGTSESIIETQLGAMEANEILLWIKKISTEVVEHVEQLDRIDNKFNGEKTKNPSSEHTGEASGILAEMRCVLYYISENLNTARDLANRIEGG